MKRYVKRLLAGILTALLFLTGCSKLADKDIQFTVGLNEDQLFKSAGRRRPCPRP